MASVEKVKDSHIADIINIFNLKSIKCVMIGTLVSFLLGLTLTILIVSYFLMDRMFVKINDRYLNNFIVEPIRVRNENSTEVFKIRQKVMLNKLIENSITVLENTLQLQNNFKNLGRYIEIDENYKKTKEELEAKQKIIDKIIYFNHNLMKNPSNSNLDLIKDQTYNWRNILVEYSQSTNISAKQTEIALFDINNDVSLNFINSGVFGFILSKFFIQVNCYILIK